MDQPRGEKGKGRVIKMSGKDRKRSNTERRNRKEFGRGEGTKTNVRKEYFGLKTVVNKWECGQGGGGARIRAPGRKLNDNWGNLKFEVRLRPAIKERKKQINQYHRAGGGDGENAMDLCG